MSAAPEATGLRSAIAFLTPLGGAAVPSSRTLRWFPVVGLLLGAAVGGIWRVADELWPPALAAAIAVVADLALTGMLHLDGVVDAADGLLPHLDRPRRLEVMREPTVGAFGVVIAVAVLLVRWAALASMHPDVWLVAGLWCLSRTAMAAVMAALPYARTGGLASAFAGPGRLAVVLAGAVAAAAVVAVGVGWPTIAVVAAASVAVAGTAALARARIGGYTGDVLGAAGVLAETVGLVVAAARW